MNGNKWAASSEFGTYRLCEQRRFRRACASAQSRQNLRCSLIQAVSPEEPSNRKPDPWPLSMAGHAQLKFVMTECSKTQIRLTRPKCQLRNSLTWKEEKIYIITLPNIGIKHDFLCINICWAPREVLKSEQPERRGFQHLPRGPAEQEQDILSLPISQTLNNISVIMLLHTFNIILFIPGMRNYVIGVRGGGEEAGKRAEERSKKLKMSAA